jgi:hypothetical protein
MGFWCAAQQKAVMANLFDSTNYPTSEPGLAEYGNPIVAGNFVPWRKTGVEDDYPSATYSMAYQATLNGTPATGFTVAGSVASSEWQFEIAAATTASLTVGIYQWNLYVTRTSDSERLRLDSGSWEVVPNIRTDTSTDPQSHARKVLTAIEAVIEGRASQDQVSYSIAGRSLARMPIEDLLLFRGRYRAEWLKEKRLHRGKKGLGNDGIILTRLAGG